jgi:glycosyltransferase involved in cell wall biosynthesis
VRAMPAIIASEPKAVLLILGDGEQRQALHNLATELGVQDCVVFAGARDDVPNLLAIMEVAVLPTICTEAMGRVLVEAAAAGKPVVATRLGGVEDVVVDNETGLIVAPEDAAALSAAIVRVLADPALAATMGAAARIRAERFSLDAMMQKLNALYTSFL